MSQNSQYAYKSFELIDDSFSLKTKVIDQMLKEDLELVFSKTRRRRENGKPHGYFHEKQMAPFEWAALRSLLDVLEVCTIPQNVHIERLKPSELICFVSTRTVALLAHHQENGR